MDFLKHASVLASALGLCLLLACNRGYQSASDLETEERGPAQCAKSCHELGMRMSAFVLVESDVAGCVCEPMHVAPGPYGPPGPPMPEPQRQSTRSITGAAAGYVVVAMRRAAAHQQQQQRPPPAGQK